MKILKDINDVNFTDIDVHGTVMPVSDPIVMASAAGWYVGQICEENDFLQPFDRLTDYMSKSQAVALVKGMNKLEEKGWV